MTHKAKRNVLLYGYFGAGNLGDDLLLAITCMQLHKMMSDAKLFVRDHGEISDLQALRLDAVFTGLETILADKTKTRTVRLGAYLRAYARLFRQCGWLIFSGGTLFHERGTLTALVLQYTICLLARFQGVRIAALGVGIADLRSPTARWLLRHIVDMSDLFLVRDEAALRQCAGTKARLTNDLVFADPALTSAPRHETEAPRIGLTIYPPACGGIGGAQVRAKLVGSIRAWQAAGYKIVYLICQRGGVTMGDDTIFRQLNAELGADAKLIEMHTLSADAATIAQQIGDCTVVCGMRYHALVLAAMLGRPFVGITHDNKISEICRAFSMPCYSIDELTKETLVQSIETIKNRFPDASLVERARKSAQENFRSLSALMT